MTAELDPLDAVIERIRRSEPPADGWRRARTRAAGRRRRLPAFALAATAVALLVWWTNRPMNPAVPDVKQPAPDVAHVPGQKDLGEVTEDILGIPDLPPPEPVAFGGSAGTWAIPRMTVAAAAPVLVSTGGATPIKLGDHTPAGRVGTRLHVWNWEKSPTSRVLDADAAGEFAVTPDGGTLLIGDGRAIDLASGKATPLAWWGDGGLKLRPAWLRFSPDGKTLLAFEHDQKVGTARLIDYPAGTERGRAEGLWWAGSRGAFSADGKTLALCGSDAHPRTFDAATGKERVKYSPAFANTIQSIALSADGSRVMGSYRGNLRVWDTTTGKLVCEPDTRGLGPHPEFNTAAFSPDGKLFATGGGGVPLLLWDAATGKRVRTFPRESMGAEHVRFDAAGTTITTVNGFHGRRTEQRTDVTVYPTVGRWRTASE